MLSWVSQNWTQTQAAGAGNPTQPIVRVMALHCAAHERWVWNSNSRLLVEQPASFCVMAELCRL